MASRQACVWSGGWAKGDVPVGAVRDLCDLGVVPRILLDTSAATNPLHSLGAMSLPASPAWRSSGPRGRIAARDHCIEPGWRGSPSCA